MPIYPCKCKSCGKTDEVFLRMSDCENLPNCCGAKMARVFTPPYVVEDMKPYISPIDRSIVSSRKAHRDHMVKHDVIEAGNEKMRPKKRIEPDSKDIIADIHKAYAEQGIS